MAKGTLDANAQFPSVLPVSIPFYNTVGQNVVFRSDHIVIVPIIYIISPYISLSRLWPLIYCGQHIPTSKYLLQI